MPEAVPEHHVAAGAPLGHAGDAPLPALAQQVQPHVQADGGGGRRWRRRGLPGPRPGLRSDISAEEGTDALRRGGGGAKRM